MTPAETTQEQEKSYSSKGDNGGTAPDSETQSSAASAQGDRTTEEGSRATENPAEGADFDNQ
ncbi:hypothetical protein BN8_04710 [Fibrisoma limi BUZ 3]|uniref:Uncharacterized protein n=1 Tax=Fibrisoma limi BUZ 3 TaxID=1185876 RepID=I2GNH3_9BACT|nr:hypothetical protein [Fibrisoma limi]CCH55451.1 hypothetical protein BN8_04710 [Fibrisoma limi BUZ 3]